MCFVCKQSNNQVADLFDVVQDKAEHGKSMTHRHQVLRATAGLVFSHVVDGVQDLDCFSLLCLILGSENEYVSTQFE